jgi:hypothetical protein
MAAGADVVSTLRNCRVQRESIKQPGWIERADAWKEPFNSTSLSPGEIKGKGPPLLRGTTGRAQTKRVGVT